MINGSQENNKENLLQFPLDHDHISDMLRCFILISLEKSRTLVHQSMNIITLYKVKEVRIT
jgi:hypothetical protein